LETCRFVGWDYRQEIDVDRRPRQTIQHRECESANAVQHHRMVEAPIDFS